MTETIKSPNIRLADTTPSPDEEDGGSIDDLTLSHEKATELNTETTEQAFESWGEYLEYIRGVAELCVWDDERGKPVVDKTTIDKRKKSATWKAREEASLLVPVSEEYEGVEIIERYFEDGEVVKAVLSELEDNSEKLLQTSKEIEKLRGILSSANTDSQRRKIESIIAREEEYERILREHHGKINMVLARKRVAEVLEMRAHADIDGKALRAPEELERAVSDRIAADRYPWTMPGAEKVDPKKIENMLKYYRILIEHQAFGDSTEDEVRIPGLMPDEIASLEHRGVTPVRGHNVFSREDLRRAGVFFVNTVGEGEQPIFGEVITDREGRFDPRKKAFLTEEEFKRVYNFQQREGYGIGDLDPDDVVMDMIAADQVRNTRGYNLVGVERISKYGNTSSLFVDNEGDTLPESFGGWFEIDEKQYRLSSVQTDLINGHRDFPGVSEMYQSSRVAWDQRYMTASQYVRYIYSPLPTPKEAFHAIKVGSSTKRERDWLGTPLFIVESKNN